MCSSGKKQVNKNKDVEELELIMGRYENLINLKDYEYYLDELDVKIKNIEDDKEKMDIMVAKKNLMEKYYKKLEEEQCKKIKELSEIEGDLSDLGFTFSWEQINGKWSNIIYNKKQLLKNLINLDEIKKVKEAITKIEHYDQLMNIDKETTEKMKQYKDSIEMLSKNIDELKDIENNNISLSEIEDILHILKLLNIIIEDYSKNGSLSANTVATIAGSYPQYLKYLNDKSTFVYNINLEAYKLIDEASDKLIKFNDFINKWRKERGINKQ